MGPEAVSEGRVASFDEECAQWPSDIAIRFESFRLAYRAWHDSSAALDWICRNDHAVTLLSASNVLPSHFTRAEEEEDAPRRLEPPCASHCASSSCAKTAVELVVYTACCGVLVRLTEEEQLTLAEIPRVFPFRSGSFRGASRTSQSSSELERQSAQVTSLERHERVVEELLMRLHKVGCAWLDLPPPPPEHSAGAWRGATPCTVRQLLLGTPSLRLTDSALVRTFCSALSLNTVGAKDASGTARGHCLLPRGTPPSVVRTWMENAVGVLAPRQAIGSGAEEQPQEVRHGSSSPMRLRYEGSNVNDRILQLLFTPKKRVRQDTAGDAVEAGDIISESMGLLMALYGYTVDNTEAAATLKKEKDIVDDGESPACEDVSSQLPSAAIWDGPPLIINSQDMEKGDARVHVETAKQRRTVPASEALNLLGWRLSCQFCAQAPPVSILQEELCTTTTTTTQRTIVTVTADSMSWPRDEGEDTSATGGVAASDAQRSVEAETHTSRHPTQDPARGERSAQQTTMNTENANAGATPETSTAANEEENERGVSLPSAMVPCAEHANEEGVAGDPREERGTSTSMAHSNDSADMEAELNELEHVGRIEAADQERVGSAGESDSLTEHAEEALAIEQSPAALLPQVPVKRASPAAITTVTKTVTTTSVTTVTESTTTIIVTFSRRNPAPRGPGHLECCPWHNLFLNDAIDATALATAERHMDFTWVVDETAEPSRPVDSEDEGEQARDEGTGTFQDFEGETFTRAPLTADKETDVNRVSSSAPLEVVGKAISLVSHGQPEAESPHAVVPDSAEADACGNTCVEAATHSTVLILRFSLSEVERLIGTWRRSEEWEHVRPDQYIPHPLWRTWSTADVLHPIHTEAADGVMEQYLRGLERRLTSQRQGDDDDDEVCRTCVKEGGESDSASAQALRACLASTPELLTTIGAPLFQPSKVSASKTVESALRLAEASVEKCSAGAGPAPHPAPDSNTNTRTLLMDGLRSLLAASASRPALASENGAKNEGAHSSTESTVQSFLNNTQQRFADDVLRVENCALFRSRAALRHEALPRIFFPFIAPHYSTAQTTTPAAASSVGDGLATERPLTVQPSPTAAADKEVAVSASSPHHTMTSADRALVAKYLQDMRQTIQEEQQQLQREREAEAERVAAASAAAAAAAAAASASAAAEARAQASASRTLAHNAGTEASSQGSMRTASNLPPSPSPQQHHNSNTAGNQRGNTNGLLGGNFNVQGQHPNGNIPITTSNSALPHTSHGQVADRRGGFPPRTNMAPTHQQQHQQQGGSWSNNANLSVSSSPPPPVFSYNDAMADVFSGASPVLSQGMGMGAVAGGRTSVMASNAAVLPGSSPFNWSPLASGIENVGGSSEGVLSFLGAGSSSALQASSPQPPPVLPGGGFIGGGGGGRTSDGRHPRNTFGQGGSVLSSAGSSGDEVRLSNWSALSNPTHGSGSGILSAPSAGVLSTNMGGHIRGDTNSSNSGVDHARPLGPTPTASSSSTPQPGRGAPTGASVPRRGGGGGGGGGGHSNHNPHASHAPLSGNAGRPMQSGSPSGGTGGGGRSGRGRGRAPWRGGGGGGAGRGGSRRAGG